MSILPLVVHMGYLILTNSWFKASLDPEIGLKSRKCINLVSLQTLIPKKALKLATIGGKILENNLY